MLGPFPPLLSSSGRVVLAPTFRWKSMATLIAAILERISSSAFSARGFVGQTTSNRFTPRRAATSSWTSRTSLNAISQPSCRRRCALFSSRTIARTGSPRTPKTPHCRPADLSRSPKTAYIRTASCFHCAHLWQLGFSLGSSAVGLYSIRSSDSASGTASRQRFIRRRCRKHVC